MILNINATGIDLTDAIRQTVEEKFYGLEKYFDNIVQIDADVGKKTGNHHRKGDIYYAEVTIHVPGETLFVEKSEDDLYKAINKVKDHCKYVLDDYKEKMRQVDRKHIRSVKAYTIEKPDED